MRRKNVPVAARRTRACRWRRNPAWFGRTFFRVSTRGPLLPFVTPLKFVGLFWTSAKSSLFFPLFPFVNDSEKREIFTLAKTITTIRSYSLSRIAFDALDCLFTRENVSSLRFLPRSSFPLDTFTCIRRKEWYSRRANGWTSSFFVGIKEFKRVCGSQSNLGL